MSFYLRGIQCSFKAFALSIVILSQRTFFFRSIHSCSVYSFHGFRRSLDVLPSLWGVKHESLADKAIITITKHYVKIHHSFGPGKRRSFKVIRIFQGQFISCAIASVRSIDDRAVIVANVDASLTISENGIFKVIHVPHGQRSLRWVVLWRYQSILSHCYRCDMVSRKIGVTVLRKKV